ncbi:MAG: hypothetical protein OHK0031_05010 [Anaerolineales bacterium]
MGGTFCNDASLVEQNDGRYHTLGDPTEGALLVAGASLGQWKERLDAAFPRVAELPFDSERKRMTTVHQVNGKLGNWEPGTAYLAFTKGSADGLLEISSRVWVDGNIEALDENWRGRILSAGEKLAARGMRVLLGMTALEIAKR